MPNWTSQIQPFGKNHAPLLLGWASDDSGPVPVAVDKTTGGILISGGGSGGTSSTFGAGFPLTGTAVGASDGTSMKPLLVDASGYLEVNVKAGSGSGLSVTDSAAWTAASSAFVPSGGVFNDSATALTSGQQGTQRLTPNRGTHVNLRNNAGTEIGTSTTPVQVSLANTAANATAVKVDGSAVTQPVSGTITANAGTGTFAISASTLPLPTGASTAAKQDTGNTSLASIDGKVPALGQALAAASVPVVLTAAQITTLTPLSTVTVQQSTASNLKVDPSGVTSPISAASLPLPTGAATSAKQPALGTAGTASSDVITVQGIASMTPLKVDGSGVTQPISGSITANAGTNLNTSLLALESGGNLATTATNTTGLNNTVGTAASAIPTKLLQVGGSDGTNARAIKTNTSGQLDIRPLTSSDQVTIVPSGTQTVSGTVSITANSAVNVAQINGVTPLMGNGTSGTGAQRVTIASDSTGQVALAAGSALVGKVGIDQTTPGTTNAVVDTPVTSGGLSIVTGSVGATATAIKASAGQLYGYHLFNTTAAVAYVQIFNVAAASVTLGTTTPTISIGIPASGGVTVNFDKGIAFGTAISYACTTTRTGSSGATCDVNFYYK